MTIDDRMQDALARLTENEKLCLRRRLLPQTAKEMALDLGVSPHAIEKRLKMARTKLGLSSSLDAARLLAAAERGDRLVPPSSDLAADGPKEQLQPDGAGPARSRQLGAAILPGAMVMSLFATLIAAALQTASAPSPAAARPPAAGEVKLAIEAPWRLGRMPPRPMRTASPAEVRSFLAGSFAIFDRDHSAYIEPAEAPATGFGPPHHAGGPRPRREAIGWLTGKPAQAYWIAQNDTDGDGRVSEAEYIAFGYAGVAARGVPVDWKPQP